MSPPSDALAISASLDALASAKSPALHHFKLENGLSVYLSENHATPLAAVQLWYHVGTSDEPPGRSHLSHLLEHLIFQGSSKLPAGQYSRLIAYLGGTANATTHEDATAFDITLPAARLPVALEIMADAMATSCFDQAAFELEVLAVAAERRLKVDNSTYEWALQQHRRLAYGDSPYAEPSFGHDIDLEETDLETVRTWYRTWYHPNNATLVVAGATTPQDLRRHVNAYFASLPPAALRDKPALRHAQTLRERSQQLVHPKLGDGLIMSFNVPSQATAPTLETSVALQLLESILGIGFSAMLYSRLIRDRLLLRTATLTYEHPLRGDTLFTLQVSTTPAITPGEAATEILSLIDELRTAPLPDEVLAREKLRLLARHTYERADLNEQATLVGHAASAGMDPAQLAEIPRIIQRLGGSTLQQVAAQYLCRERLSTTYLLQGEPA